MTNEAMQGEADRILQFMRNMRLGYNGAFLDVADFYCRLGNTIYSGDAEPAPTVTLRRINAINSSLKDDVYTNLIPERKAELAVGIVKTIMHLTFMALDFGIPLPQAWGHIVERGAAADKEAWAAMDKYEVCPNALYDPARLTRWDTAPKELVTALDAIINVRRFLLSGAGGRTDPWQTISAVESTLAYVEGCLRTEADNQQAVAPQDSPAPAPHAPDSAS